MSLILYLATLPYCLLYIDYKYTLLFENIIFSQFQTLGKSSQQQDRLKKCIDVKQALKGVLEKYRELRVQKGFSSCLQFDDAESSDSDEEFEDVPEKEGYEPFIPEHLRAEYG